VSSPSLRAANQSGEGMEGLATPARWTTPTPVPVTPTKGSKRMAVGTRRPIRHSRPARLMPVGFAAASALDQILAAIAGMERKMEEGSRRQRLRVRRQGRLSE